MVCIKYNYINGNYCLVDKYREILAKCEGWPNGRTSVVRRNSEETIIFVKTNLKNVRASH